VVTGRPRLTSRDSSIWLLDNGAQTKLIGRWGIREVSRRRDHKRHLWPQSTSAIRSNCNNGVSPLLLFRRTGGSRVGQIERPYAFGLVTLEITATHGSSRNHKMSRSKSRPLEEQRFCIQPSIRKNLLNVIGNVMCATRPGHSDWRSGLSTAMTGIYSILTLAHDEVHQVRRLSVLRGSGSRETGL
jgi:hypothetical protein